MGYKFSRNLATDENIIGRSLPVAAEPTTGRLRIVTGVSRSGLQNTWVSLIVSQPKFTAELVTTWLLTRIEQVAAGCNAATVSDVVSQPKFSAELVT